MKLVENYTLFFKIEKIRFFLTFAFCFLFFKMDAQNTIRINYKNGDRQDVLIDSIDSITFVEKDVKQYGVSFLGEWFWGSREKGYYEVLSFNEDRTYFGYDYYLDYGFDAWTYGMYMSNDIILNLWSYGYGYRRNFRWYVTALTENALEVMTQMGKFTYYRVQPEVYLVKIDEESYMCNDGDNYVFTDGVKVLEVDGMLKGISKGMTYILKYNTSSGLIMAFKVIVE